MSDSEIKCCNRTYAAKKYELIKCYCVFYNLLKICKALGLKTREIKKETYKKTYCTECGTFIIEYNREYKDNKIKKRFGRLKNKKAIEYLAQNADNSREIIDYSVQKGSSSAANFFYGHNNRQYTLNDKATGLIIQPKEFEPVLATLAS